MNTGNFLLKRHPLAMPFLDFSVNAADADPDLETFHHKVPWEQRALNAVVRSPWR